MCPVSRNPSVNRAEDVDDGLHDGLSAGEDFHNHPSSIGCWEEASVRVPVLTLGLEVARKRLEISRLERATYSY